MNRQESHRIYLQQFAPRGSASNPNSRPSAGGAAPVLHRHGSHEIHPPNYPATAPGSPYQFSVPSSSDNNSQSSYSFSSLSNGGTPVATPAHSRHANGGSQASQGGGGGAAPQHHRPPPSQIVRNRGPSTVTTSAAVRLTDKARARDVTALLRGKFGLPPISSSGNDKNSSSGNHRRNKNESLSSYYATQHGGDRSSKVMPTRLSQVKKEGSFRFGHNVGIPTAIATPTSEPAPKDDEGEVDALVIVGTIEGPPRGYLRFEHEDSGEERRRLELFRSHYARRKEERERERSLLGQDGATTAIAVEDCQRQMLQTATGPARLPISESTATVQASGAQPGWTSSALLAPSAPSEGASMYKGGSGDPGPNPLGMSRSGPIGLDLSSSRDGSTGGRGAGAGGVGGGRVVTSWGSLRGIGSEGMDFSSSGGKLTTLVSELSAPSPAVASPRQAEPRSTPPRLRGPSPCLERASEPIHVVRTVLSDERPLRVRDEMMDLLGRLRRKSEEEMGLCLDDGVRRPLGAPAPTFRWYFQPCSPLGGAGPSERSPKIQGVPAYIDVEGYCTEDESESDGDGSDDDDGKSGDGRENVVSSTGGENRSMPIVPTQLIEERRRIAMLRDLSDPSFLVSGYLLKQSWRDPNVWKRVYCVLSEDRLWTIRRMKPLKKDRGSVGLEGGEDMISSLRVGRHKYIKLHRSLLLERGEGNRAANPSSKHSSSSRYDGRRLTPLGHRLPNAFRMLTSHGKCHTFRAYNSHSFRVWTLSLSEKIAQKHGDGMMDLADVIAEEETLARCRRMDDIAVSPLRITSESKSPIPMDVVRFGIAVAAFRELRRHVDDAIRQYNNQRARAVNVQTRVGGHVGGRTSRGVGPPSPTPGQRAKNAEHLAMASSVWEDARIVASKSAQLLHALATLRHDELSGSLEGDASTTSADGGAVEGDALSAPPDGRRNAVMEKLIEEQKAVQATLGRYWDRHHQQLHNTNAMDDAGGHFALPPTQMFDPLLEKLQTVLN